MSSASAWSPERGDEITARPLARGGSASALDGQRAADGGAVPGLGVDVEGAADRGQPVGHALQAGAVGGLGGVEAVAVVGDGELEETVGAGQGDGGPGGPGVFGDVLQG